MSIYTRTSWLLPSCLLGLIGCGAEEIKLEGGPDAAKAIVVRILDSWKAGEAVDVWAKSKPPIIVRDEDWEDGKTLVDYTLEEAPESNGSHWRVYANLKVTTPGKKTTSSRVCYAVTLGSASSVLRTDYLN
jgi:hypothetical protein